MSFTKNSAMQEFINNLEKVANYNIDILLQGETGVGKDFWAKYIHEKYNSQSNFIAINCAAIPENLVEAELFGTEAGAYTGARKRIGKIELANNGSLYLDEIDSMPINIQAKLLRALQEKGCERIGSSVFIPSNFRVIASTKNNLLDLISSNRFRDDLYYRLNVVKLEIPSLRERKEDILDLFIYYINYFSNKFNIDFNKNTLNDKTLSSNLLKYNWPGNIRELISFSQRFLLNIPLELDNIINENTFNEDLKTKLKNIEKSIISSVLEKNNYSLSKTSQELGLPIPTLHYRIKLLNIRI